MSKCSWGSTWSSPMEQDSSIEPLLFFLLNSIPDNEFCSRLFFVCVCVCFFKKCAQVKKKLPRGERTATEPMRLLLQSSEAQTFPCLSSSYNSMFPLCPKGEGCKFTISLEYLGDIMLWLIHIFCINPCKNNTQTHH